MAHGTVVVGVNEDFTGALQYLRAELDVRQLASDGVVQLGRFLGAATQA